MRWKLTGRVMLAIGVVMGIVGARAAAGARDTEADLDAAPRPATWLVEDGAENAALGWIVSSTGGLIAVLAAVAIALGTRRDRHRPIVTLVERRALRR